MKNAYLTLVDLANEALEHRKSGDSKAFKKCIDDFILHDLNYASGERTASLLEMLLMIGVNNPEERYKRELVAALSRTLYTKNFYTIEDGIMASDIPDHLMPIIFNLVARGTIEFTTF